MNVISHGNLITALPVNEHKAVGVTTLAQLQSFGLMRPTTIDKKPKGAVDPRTLNAHAIHEETQRNFDKARKDRADNYAGYIKSIDVENAMGGTPPITLFIKNKMIENEDGSLMIPYNEPMAAIDGETQTEARFILAEHHPETMDTPIAITIYHGIPVDHAKQILHDVNHYVTPVSELKASTFNNNGAISIAVKKAISTMDVSDINMNGEGATKKTKFAYAQVMTFIAGCQLSKEYLSKSVTAKIMSELNSPAGKNVGVECIENAVAVIDKALVDEKIGKANKSLWQLAGVLCSQGKDVSTLNWNAAIETYNQFKVSGRGGKRVPTSEKLSAIAVAFVK